MLSEPHSGAVEATVVRLTRIGFEVRAEVRTAGQPAGATTWVQLTRGQADGLGLAEGSQVWLLAAPSAALVAS